MASTNKANPKWRRQTQLIRGGTMRSEFGETSEAIFMNSGFVYDSPEIAEARFKNEIPGYVYSRFRNPTVAMFEGRMALLEGAPACRATASGMAAVSAALMCFVKAGDHIVAAKALFGSCRYILDEVMPRFGVSVTLVEGTDLSQWQAAVKPGQTVALFLETPSNPTLEILDLQSLGNLANEIGAKLIVDNVFATPVLQRPMETGAHIVVYSATKHIDGSGRCLGGAILSDTAFSEDILGPYLRNTGPSLSPFNAWVLLKGLETLEMRVHKSCDNALKLAQFLEQQKGITRVIYPGLASHPQQKLANQQMEGRFGTIVTFEVPNGRDGAFALLNRLELIDISNNLGDSKSLITHPATTTHQRLKPEVRAEMGITDGMVRLSVGLEDVEDLIEDLAQALKL